MDFQTSIAVGASAIGALAAAYQAWRLLARGPGRIRELRDRVQALVERMDEWDARAADAERRAEREQMDRRVRQLAARVEELSGGNGRAALRDTPPYATAARRR